MVIRKDYVASRRTALKAGLAAVAGGLAATAATRAAVAQEKIAQNVVQYQETPKDGAECDKCVNFQAPNACTIVAGTINPKGWCVAFAPKDS
jgi:hypothetical protein